MIGQCKRRQGLIAGFKKMMNAARQPARTGLMAGDDFRGDGPVPLWLAQLRVALDKAVMGYEKKIRTQEKFKAGLEQAMAALDDLGSEE